MDPVHRRLAEVGLRVSARYGFALAGGYAVQAHGLVERFNRRLAEAIRSRPATGNAGKNKFTSQAQRDAFLHTFADSYNKTRLKCLDYNAPAQAIANLAGHNTFAGMTTGGGGTWEDELRRRWTCP